MSEYRPRIRRTDGPTRVWLLVAVAFLTAAAPAMATDDVSFGTDVMAVLSKAGCNMGVCHGNASGKGGFKLSLRGDSPEADFAVLTRDLSGRRTNPVEPDRSLILLKPTMQVPHEGGQRFKAGSAEFNVLRAWIAAGMHRDPEISPRPTSLAVSPPEKVIVAPEIRTQLHVVAIFSDGTRRDVTTQAVYETSEPLVTVNHDGLVEAQARGETTVIVRYLNLQQPARLAFIPDRPDFSWTGPPPANFIDEHVFRKLQSLRVNPSAACDDAVFLRRASLDLLGVLATADEARRFVDDSRTDKRARLVDDLLERQEFADFWALKWSDLLRNEEKTLDRKGVQDFHAWIRHSIAVNKPLDQFVRELIASRGSTYENPPANYYRAMRDPFMRAESTAQLFLGVRLQCAKCHNHPFARWTQDDYYSWANVFARVKYQIIENNRKDRNDSHEFDGEQIVLMAREGDVEDPRRGKPLRPRFLSETAVAPLKPDADRLLELAHWLTTPGNDLFARSQVNRIWHALLGRGIVDPIDDFRPTNPPVNPPLLDALTRDFVAHQFDVRHLIRTIMNSQTYQLSAIPNDTNRDDTTSFSHARLRRLSAEQLLDSLSQVAGAPLRFNGYPEGLRAGELPGVNAIRIRDERASAGDQFLKLFGKPPRLVPCECERSQETTLNQAFQLVSGPLINELLTRPDNRLQRLLDSSRPQAELIDELYWTALSRPPTSEERQSTATFLTESRDPRKALEDIAWGLVNSNEFMLRR